MSPAAVRRLRALAPVVPLAAIAVALVVLGRGPLATPPLGSVADLSRWGTEHDPVLVGLAVLRVGALLVTAHLVVTSSIAAAGHLLRRPAVVEAADAWTLPPFRTALRRAAGLGLSAAAALSAPLPGADAATMRSGAGPTQVLAPTTDRGSGTATIRVVAPRPHHGTATLAVRPSPPPSPPRSPTPPPSPTPRPAEPVAPDRHVVGPGDHLWRIAADTLAGTLGRRPTDAEVAPYWRRVVAANPHLVDPDLLHPGDEVALPSPVSR